MSIAQALLDKAKARSLEIAITGLSSVALAVIDLARGLIDAHIAPRVFSSVSPQVLLQMLISAGVLLGSCLVYLLVRSGLRLKCGIYWDRDRNPYCPVCKKPVNYDEWSFYGLGYHCQSCKTVYPLSDATGKKYKPEEVIRML